MTQYIMVQPGPGLTQTVLVTHQTYVIAIPDDVNPYHVNPQTAADNPAYAIIPLIEQLEWEDTTEVLKGTCS
jgi:hypothetical protein